MLLVHEPITVNYIISRLNGISYEDLPQNHAEDWLTHKTVLCAFFEKKNPKKEKERWFLNCGKKRATQKPCELNAPKITVTDRIHVNLISFKFRKGIHTAYYRSLEKSYGQPWKCSCVWLKIKTKATSFVATNKKTKQKLVKTKVTVTLHFKLGGKKLCAFGYFVLSNCGKKIDFLLKSR